MEIDDYLDRIGVNDISSSNRDKSIIKNLTVIENITYAEVYEDLTYTRTIYRARGDARIPVEFSDTAFEDFDDFIKNVVMIKDIHYGLV